MKCDLCKKEIAIAYRVREIKNGGTLVECYECRKRHEELRANLLREPKR